MSGITGAVVVGGIAAAGTVAAASMSASATRSATNASIRAQQGALDQQSSLSAPYRQLGTDAMAQYEALLGIAPPPPPQQSFSWEGQGGQNGFPMLPGPGGAGIRAGLEQQRLANGTGPNGQPQPNAPSNTSMLDALTKTPGYQFALEQGQRGVMNQASLGGGVSGNTLADLTKFNQGLAETTYQGQVDNLARAVGTGQAAAAGQAQNVGASSDNISSALINQGNTMAGIDANAAAGITKAIGSATEGYMTSQTLKSLQDQSSSGTTWV